MAQLSWRNAMPARLSLPAITVAAALGSLGARVYSKRDGAASDVDGINSLASWFVLLWIGGFAISGLYLVFVYPFYVSPLRNLPTPPDAHWLFGHMPYMMKAAPGRPSRKWNESIPHDGLIRFRFFFNAERLIALSPKAIAEIIVTNAYAFQKPLSTRKTLASITGNGLVVIEGDEHRVQRRNLMPAFTFRHIKDLYPVFWDKTREGVRAMTASVGGAEGELVVSSWASRSTLDIIGMAAMGRDFGAVRDPENPLVSKYTKVFDNQSLTRLFAVLGLFLPRWAVERIPTRRIREFREAAGAIRQVCRDVVEEKRAKFEADKGSKEKPQQEEVNIMSVALESGQFSDESLADHLMTFFAAGHETTSVSLTWALYALCRNPEMQRRLRDEVRANLPSVDDDESGGAAAAVSSVSVDRLPYLNAVVNETLRLYAAVPLSVREATRDTTVQGVPVPRGTAITIPLWAINVDRGLWGDDADEFRPERWIDRRESEDGRGGYVEVPNNTGGARGSNYAFMTFLQGPRSCIGASFARGEFACLLAGWVGRFEFELVDKELMDETKLKVSSGVTMKPRDGLKVTARVVPGW